MGLQSSLIKPFAKGIARNIDQWSGKAVSVQEKVFHQLISQASNTAFGKEHGFDKIRSYEDYCRQVPLRDYEALRPWVDRIIAGESNVLWKGKPKYFAKTSGTTSGVKYIPLTKESMPNHFGTARNALFNYYARSGKGKWLDGKMIFLSGSPELSEKGGIPTGRLSGIVNHVVPAWLQRNQLPSYPTNCIEDWEEKLGKIVAETWNKDMRLISGIPPWVQMYFERLLEKTGKKTVREIFPNFEVFVYGGVNYEPYRARMEELMGGKVASVETYPASEGFIAFQDVPGKQGLLLNASSGIFFEFVPVDEIFKEQPKRVWLKDVVPGKNYAIIINSNAGLWGYNIGDTVSFLETKPPRLVVTGRIKHFISAFGEHVIGKEVESALLAAASQQNVRIVEFTVAPQINPQEGMLPFHEWFVEFHEQPKDLTAFAGIIDQHLAQQNIYYDDLIKGKVLDRLKITVLKKDAFRNYMKTQGKLGGQNKVPRLSNDRKIADALKPWIMIHGA